MQIKEYRGKYSSYSVQPIKSKGKMSNLSDDNKENNSNEPFRQQKSKDDSFEKILKSKIDIRI